MNNINEKEYRSTLVRIGGTMLVFLFLFNIFNISALKAELVFRLVLDEKGVYIAKSLAQSLAYLASFLLPAGFYYLISKKNHSRPVMTEVRLDRQFALIVPSVISIIVVSAVINMRIVEVFDFSSFYDKYLVTDPLDENYKLVLEIIGTALVPAMCEEYLFRGVFLTNLLPYGKTPAIIISAVLFGLMHQNPGQLLYATVAGILLGMVYVRTRSVWGGILIHFLNNLFSVTEQLLYDRLAGDTADIVCLVMETVIIASGAVCTVILLCTAKKRIRNFDESGYGAVLEADDNYIERPLRKGVAVKCFFNPTIIIFSVVVIMEMLLYILMALEVIGI